jgi:hypothetical protein
MLGDVIRNAPPPVPSGRRRVQRPSKHVTERLERPAAKALKICSAGVHSRCVSAAAACGRYWRPNSMNGIALAIAIVASTTQHPDLAFFGTSRLSVRRSRARRYGQPVFGPMRAAVRGTSYSGAIPFSANSSLALWFFSRCVRPMPRRILGALVNWIFE